MFLQALLPRDLRLSKQFWRQRNLLSQKSTSFPKWILQNSLKVDGGEGCVLRGFYTAAQEEKLKEFIPIYFNIEDRYKAKELIGVRPNTKFISANSKTKTKSLDAIFRLYHLKIGRKATHHLWNFRFGESIQWFGLKRNWKRRPLNHVIKKNNVHLALIIPITPKSTQKMIRLPAWKYWSRV